MVCAAGQSGERKVRRDDLWSMAKWGEEGKERLYLEQSEGKKKLRRDKEIKCGAGRSGERKLRRDEEMICGAWRSGERRVKRDDMWSKAEWRRGR